MRLSCMEIQNIKKSFEEFNRVIETLETNRKFFDKLK